MQIGKECMTCRESVAAFDMSYFAKRYLVGPDAQKAADWIFCNDMQKPPCELTHQSQNIYASLTLSKLWLVNKKHFIEYVCKLYYSNVPTYHWYHSYIASCS